MDKSLLESYDIEKKAILREYRALLRALKYKLTDATTKRRFHNAFKTAAEAHKNMRRKSGEPYILHPIAVAKIAVVEMGLGVRSAITALLHDVVEDTEITAEDIARRFGSEVALMVEGLTKIDMAVETEGSTQADNFKRILLSIVDDPRIIFIKLADRLHNMRTLDQMAREKQLKISSETSYVYAPLAHRLGFNLIKTEMEDLSLKYSKPDIYDDILNRLAESKMKRTRFIANFVRPIREKLKEVGICVRISGRTKSVYSIWNKMEKKGVTFDQIYDLFAIRIIVDEKSKTTEEVALCWKIYSIVANMYRPIQERMRDWISNPKNNEYTALHTTVVTPKGRPVEVQIRSRRMDEIAEQGMAAHWKYKQGSEQESLFDKWLQRIRETLSDKSMESDSVDFLISFKNNFLEEELYVFTHQGDIKSLPSGASVIDFAYSVHSDIGNACFAAKVNSKLVPIHHELKSGDQIEIITSQKQYPKLDWLQWAITNKARSKIKESLNLQKRKEAKEGEVLMKRKFRTWKIPFSEKTVHRLMARYKLNSPLELYHKVHQDNNILLEIKEALTSPQSQEKKKSKRDSSQHTRIPPLASYAIELFGRVDRSIPTTMASCCSPIPGDEIFGFLSRMGYKGVQVHKVVCPNATHLFSNYANRIVKARWVANIKSLFETQIQFSGIDKMGLINEVTSAISSMKVNILSMRIDESKGGFSGSIKLSVEDKNQLTKIFTFLKGHPHIDNVRRFDKKASTTR